MFLVCDWACSYWLSTILNKDNLHNNGKNDDSDEQSVVEESLEDIVVVGSKLS